MLIIFANLQSSISHTFFHVFHAFGVTAISHQYLDLPTQQSLIVII